MKLKFDVLSGFPKGRPGYVVDHICALAVGGLDDPINMQYQTIEEGHKKDRIERTEEGKRLFCNAQNSTPYRMVFNCKSGSGD